MKWTNIEVVARAMTRQMKKMHLFFIALLLLTACAPAPAALSQQGARFRPAERSRLAARSQAAGDVYTTLGCLVKPNERIIVGPSNTPDFINERLRLFVEQAGSVNAFLRLNGKEETGILPPFLPDQQYDLTYSTYKNISRFNADNQETGKQVAYLYRDKDVDLLDFILQGTTVSVTPNHYLFIIEGAGGGGHSPGTNPFGGAPVSAAGATQADFQNQWAITRTKEISMYVEYGESRGADVVVALFDTSPFQYVDRVIPFSETETITVAESLTRTPITMVSPMTETETITLTTVLTTTTAMTLTNHYTPVSGPQADHGIFVAGLIHEIAPEADVHLYRAFNESGYTDGFTLGSQLNQFYMDYLEPYTNPNSPLYNPEHPRRLVANMSFSISCPFGPAFDYAKFETQIAEVIEQIDRLIEEGVIVVAASGNVPVTTTVASTLYATSAITLPRAHFPASHENVISVGSLDYSGNPSCFTHDADIFVPGGGAIFSAAEAADTRTTCIQPYFHCSTESSCKEALLSYSTESDTGFAYWNGTSFAAPLVSGLVALKLSSDPPGLGPGNPPSKIEEIRGELKDKTFAASRPISATVSSALP